MFPHILSFSELLRLAQLCAPENCREFHSQGFNLHLSMALPGPGLTLSQPCPMSHPTPSSAWMPSHTGHCYSELLSATGPLYWWFPPPGMLFPWSLPVSAPVFLIKLSLASPSRSLYCSLCHILIYGPYGFCRRRQWHPTPVLLLGKSHGWRSLLGCNPCGR